MTRIARPVPAASRRALRRVPAAALAVTLVFSTASCRRDDVHPVPPDTHPISTVVTVP